MVKVKNWQALDPPRVLLVLSVVALLLRIGLAHLPFERDEGAYSYIGWRLLHGEVPYRDVWDHKPPGIYFLYALSFLLFGSSNGSIHLLASICLLARMLFLYKLTSHLFGQWAGCGAAGLYAFFSLIIDGAGANTEAFMALLSIPALYLLVYREERLWSLFLAGTCAGLAFMIKQVAIMDLLTIVAYTVLRRSERRPESRLSLIGAKLLRVLISIAGFSFAVIPFIIYAWLSGALSEFMFDVFTYNVLYVGDHHALDLVGIRHSIAEAIYQTVPIARRTLILWLSWAAILVRFLLDRWDNRHAFVLLWCFFSFLGVAMGGSYTEHYYIQILPPLAVLASQPLLAMVSVLRPTRIREMKLLHLIVLVFLGWSVLSGGLDYLSYFRAGYLSYAKDIVDVAEYVSENTEPDDLIFVWGKEPQIYFLSQRKSASKFINHYPLTRRFYVFPTARRDLLLSLENSEPELILVELLPIGRQPVFPELQVVLDTRYAIEKRIEFVEIYRRVETGETL